ncbi:hypothetical protein ACQPW3_36335 [Actinosynnema sp. CA-248983]
MSEGTELDRTDWVELDDRRIVSIHERRSSHDTYVVISHPDGTPPDVHEFEDEESAQRFFSAVESGTA